MIRDELSMDKNGIKPIGFFVPVAFLMKDCRVHFPVLTIQREKSTNMSP